MSTVSIAPRAARVLVVDPHPMARVALRLALENEPDLEMAGVAPDVPAALRLIEDGAEVDVIALDARAARPDKAASIGAFDVPVVLLRVEDDPQFARLALDAGARATASKLDAAAVVDALVTAAA